MERAQTPHQINGMNPNHRATRKCLGDSVERHAIVGVIECRYKNGAIGDVKIGVARGKPLAVHDHRAREGDRDYPERIFLRNGLEPAHVVGRPGVVLIRRILLVRQDHRVARAEAGDVVDVPMRVVAHGALAQPYSIGHSQVLVERFLVIAGHHQWIAHLHIREQPFLGHEHAARAIHLDPATLQNEALSVVGSPRHYPRRPDNGERLILEGGGIEVNGAGRMLVTEEWLLTDVQVRNPLMMAGDYEKAFHEYLGVTDTIWLGEGAVGDDTHGHIDDIARFSSRDTAILAYEQDPADENHARSADNMRRLQAVAKKDPLRIVTIPFPRPVIMNGARLPASYANFYIANGAVLVPTFNDPNDRVALNGIAEAFPGRAVIGIHAVDLVWGLGTLHCLTQQQPAAVAAAKR